MLHANNLFLFYRAKMCGATSAQVRDKHKYTDIRKGVREAFFCSPWSEYPNVVDL